MAMVQLDRAKPITEQEKQAMEKFLSWMDKQPKRLSRFLEYDPKNNIVAVLSKKEVNNTSSGRWEMIKNWIYGMNLVTNDGDIFYAKKAAGETPSTNENFLSGRMELNNPGSADTPAKTDTYDEMLTPITASRKTFTATYPKTNDGDADNTGAGVDIVTYLTSYTTSDFNATGIKGGVIHDNASPTGSSKILTHWTITSFDKSSSDTLKMFVNHTMNGV